MAQHIDTDRMRGNVNFALVKEPMTNVRKYISGVEIHKDYYQFVVRLILRRIKAASKNGSLMEQLTTDCRSRIGTVTETFLISRWNRQDSRSVISPFFMGEK